MRRLIVKRLCFLLFAAMLPLVLSTLSEAQVGRKSADMRGDLQLEVVTVPQDIAAGFERLNSQVLLYHPVNSGSDERLKTERSGNLKNYPLLIFLHGSGGSNGKIERFKWKGEVKRFAARTKGDPLVSILVPQSKGHWDPGSLDKMLEYILEKNPAIDPNRIYCIGYSMGGKGTWEWAMASPGRFAAIIPKGFIPDLTDIRGMVDLPLWAMVGTKDSKPRVEGIQAMEKTLKELGSTGVKTTYFEGANHGSTPGEIKKLDGVYDWLFSHKLPR